MKILVQKFSRLAVLSLSIAIGSLIIGLGMNIALAAWTPPSELPPLGTIAAPINISSADQYKLGGLRLGSSGDLGVYKLYIDAGGTNDKVFFRNDLEIQGHILPTAAVDQTLGSTSNFWHQLYLKSDVDSGIYFQEQYSPIIRYKDSVDQFQFIYSGSELLTVSNAGDISAQGDITAIGGLEIDSADHTLYVDDATNRVGIGTNSLTDKLVVASPGNVVIAGGKLAVGTAAVQSNINLNVGSVTAPVTGMGVAAYSSNNNAIVGNASSSSAAYGVSGLSASSYGVYGTTTSTGALGIAAGVGGYSATMHGVYGTTDSAEYNGVLGYNNAIGLIAQGDYAAGVNGWGNDILGPVSGDVRTIGVLGLGGNIPDFVTSNELYTYGVYGRAGNSMNSNSKTYGIYGIEGIETNGGLSYAGYFEGDVEIIDDLVVDGNTLKVYSTQDKVGIGTTDIPSAKLEVQGGGGAGIYAYAGDTSSPGQGDGPTLTVAAVYAQGGNVAPLATGWNFGVYGKAGTSAGGKTIAVYGITNDSTNSSAGYFKGPVEIVSGGGVTGSLSVASTLTVSGDLENAGGLEVKGSDNFVSCESQYPTAYPTSSDQGTLFVCRWCVGSDRYFGLYVKLLSLGNVNDWLKIGEKFQSGVSCSL